MKLLPVRTTSYFVAATSLLMSAPVMAQSFPADPGQFWDVTGIDLMDGGGLAYMRWLATEWKKDQEFAKSKGWISDYKILSNNYNREGEPDLYLITIYDDLPNAAESIQQRKEYFDWQAKSLEKLNEESGNRVEMRKVMGTSMLQELKLK